MKIKDVVIKDCLTLWLGMLCYATHTGTISEFEIDVKAQFGAFIIISLFACLNYVRITCKPAWDSSLANKEVEQTMLSAMRGWQRVYFLSYPVLTLLYTAIFALFHLVLFVLSNVIFDARSDYSIISLAVLFMSCVLVYVLTMRKSTRAKTYMIMEKYMT